MKPFCSSELKTKLVTTLLDCILSLRIFFVFSKFQWLELRSELLRF